MLKVLKIDRNYRYNFKKANYCEMPETDIEVQRKGLWLGMSLLFKVQSVLVKFFTPAVQPYQTKSLNLIDYLDAPMSLDSISIYN